MGAFFREEIRKIGKVAFLFFCPGRLAGCQIKQSFCSRNDTGRPPRFSWRIAFFFLLLCDLVFPKPLLLIDFRKKVESRIQFIPLFRGKGPNGTKLFSFCVPRTYSGKLKNLLVGKHRLALCAPRHMSSFTTGLAAARLFRWCWSCVSIFLCNHVCERKKLTSYKGISGENVQGFRGFYVIILKQKSCYLIQIKFISTVLNFLV